MRKHLLRICLSTLLLQFSILSLKAQWVSIPDTAFVSYLQDNFPTCMNGNLMDTTCSELVTTISVYCNHRPIKDLTGIEYFDALVELNCENDLLTSIPALPNSLYLFYCSHNQLTALPTLPNTVINIQCYSNYLTALPTLPVSLNFLDCTSNQISSIQSLPDSLTELYCGYNPINSLPNLPASLVTFGCPGTQFSSLPTLPSLLSSLTCSYNQITALPTLPNSLLYLECIYTQLTSLPSLPDSLSYLDCSNNVSLTCLPELKKIKYFYFYSTGITCLPNYPQSNTNSTPTLSAVPLCDSNNINGCSYCHANFSLFPDTANPGIYNGYNLSYGSNLNSYLWEFGDGTTSTQQYPTHTYAQAGQYYVCLTVGGSDCTNTYCDSSYLVFKTENGLMSQVNILNTTVTSLPAKESGIKQKGEPLRINPNPASASVNISVSESMLGSKLTVTDLTGREMLRTAVQSSIFNLQLSIANGIYFVTVENEKGRVTKKLVIEK